MFRYQFRIFSSTLYPIVFQDGMAIDYAYVDCNLGFLKVRSLYLIPRRTPAIQNQCCDKINLHNCIKLSNVSSLP